MPDFLRAKPLKLLALLILLTGCESSELYPAPAIPIGGGNGGGQAAPAQRPLAPAIQDPDEEAERMGNNAQTGRTVIARSASEAHSICSRWADGRGVATPQHQGNNRWLCRYY
ncbi:MAG: hypothetical protein LH679_01720 [Cyanobacteria bacterium CAN_BIN43]|nr:hypothetical protein [Cyanobacteria bacterium CAN_BIN43]